MNRDPLRILNLEANPGDHEKIKRHASATGLVLVFERASNRLEFETALRRGGIDLILADHSIPDYDGMAALESALLRLPGIPYLVVSGSIGEDRAVACVQAGARDFVHKDRLERLPAAILAATRQSAPAHGAMEAADRFREMAENIRDVFWICAPGTGKVLYVSPAYETIWGRAPHALFSPAGRWPDAVLEEDRDALDEAEGHLSEGRPYQVEYRIRRPDGSVRWILDRGFPMLAKSDGAARVVGVAADVTDRKRLETELLQSQKMELVGKLASGIAHDFNNLLTIISGYVSMLLEKETLPASEAEALKRVFTASNQATGLVRQLLMFSRKRAPKPVVIELNVEAETIASTLRRVLGETISVTFQGAPEAPRVNADLSMLEQVLMNLAVNARDSMRGKGQLAIEVTVRPAGPGPATFPAQGGGYACIAVRDTGSGIPAAILPRIFEPFFTTKDEGRGTGLGLATAKDIIKRHDGWIEVETKVGAGTVFRIFLPLTTAAVTAPPPGTTRDGRHGSGTILLVEDEGNVREFAAAVLHQEGFVLLQAKSAEDAMEVWRWHAARIDLLLTDVVLPGELSGIDLSDSLRELKPSLKVVLTTGYSRESVAPRGRAKDLFVLSKPYTPRALLHAVATVLG